MWAEEQFSIEFRDNADGVQNFINNISISSTPASGSNSSGETLDRLKEFEDSRYIMWTINTNNYYTKAYALKNTMHIQALDFHWLLLFPVPISDWSSSSYCLHHSPQDPSPNDPVRSINNYFTYTETFLYKLLR